MLATPHATPMLIINVDIRCCHRPSLDRIGLCKHHLIQSLKLSNAHTHTQIQIHTWIDMDRDRQYLQPSPQPPPPIIMPTTKLCATYILVFGEWSDECDYLKCLASVFYSSAYRSKCVTLNSSSAAAVAAAFDSHVQLDKAVYRVVDMNMACAPVYCLRLFCAQQSTPSQIEHAIYCIHKYVEREPREQVSGRSIGKLTSHTRYKTNCRHAQQHTNTTQFRCHSIIIIIIILREEWPVYAKFNLLHYMHMWHDYRAI